MKLAFIKKKKFYIPFIIVLIILFFVYRSYKKSHQPPTYETVAVSRGNLVQTVQATGKIEAVDDLALRFEIPGTVGSVMVKDGQSVKQGTVLATLKLGELNAAVSQAKANLDKQLAGATNEDRRYYEAAMTSAKVSLEQAKIDAQNNVATAEANVASAKNNLKLAEGDDQSQIVVQAYQTALSRLSASMTKLDEALSQADTILGMDNTIANGDIKNYLSITDPNKLAAAKASYLETKQAKNQAKQQVSILSNSSARADVDTALLTTEDALAKANILLANVGETLIATPAIGSLTQTSLDAKKSVIDATRTSVNTEYSSVITQKQAISNAKNSLTTYTIAYSKALNDLAQVQANADTSIKLKQAIYDQSLATYQSKVNPPRDVDVASYRAALAQAVASRDRAIIRAPIDGVIATIAKKPGELVSSVDSMMSILSPHYEIKVDISEVDVHKTKLQDTVSVTLDAFGQENKFSGKVLLIDSGPTIIQDVVYYKVRISLDDSTSTLEVKSGMTANITITTNQKQNVLFVPARSVKVNSDGERYVTVLENGVEHDYVVKIGLRADEGKQEIVEGVNEGQQVVLSKKTA